MTSWFLRRSNRCIIQTIHKPKRHPALASSVVLLICEQIRFVTELIKMELATKCLECGREAWVVFEPESGKKLIKCRCGNIASAAGLDFNPNPEFLYKYRPHDCYSESWILPHDPHLVSLSLNHPLPFPRAREFILWDVFPGWRSPTRLPRAIIRRPDGALISG